MNLKQILIALGVLFIVIGIYVFMKKQSRIQFAGGIEVTLPEHEYLDVAFSNGEVLRFRKSTSRDSQRNDINSHGIEISSSVTTTIISIDGTVTTQISEEARIRKIELIQRTISEELDLIPDCKFLQAPFNEERILKDSDEDIKILISNRLEGSQSRQFYSLKLDKSSRRSLELMEVY